MKENRNFKQSISFGWIGMATVLISMFVVQIIECAIQKNMELFNADPGPKGVKMITVMLCVYALMPMAVNVFESRWFRWFTTVTTIIFTLFMILHQLNHHLTGTSLGMTIMLLDFTHHTLGIWTSYMAIVWLRETSEVKSVFKRTQVQSF